LIEQAIETVGLAQPPRAVKAKGDKIKASPFSCRSCPDSNMSASRWQRRYVDLPIPTAIRNRQSEGEKYMLESKLSRRVVAAFAGAVVAAAAAWPAAAEPQPHMTAALAALKTAEGELAQASHDKGGHRVAALAQVRSAIKQVELGIRFDNRNPRR
jgi:hypothetical protein